VVHEIGFGQKSRQQTRGDDFLHARHHVEIDAAEACPSQTGYFPKVQYSLARSAGSFSPFPVSMSDAALVDHQEEAEK